MRPSIVRKFILPRLMRRTWPAVQRLHRELEKSQWEEPARTRELQWERVREMVALAARKSPFHRERFAEAAFDPGSLNGPEDLRRIPILEKKDLQQNRDRILIESVDPDQVTLSGTGGTTGEPTQYYWDDDYWCHSTAVSLRAYGFADFQVGDRHCMVWGTSFHKQKGSALRETLEHRLKNLLVVPGFELSSESMAVWAEKVARWEPSLVEGYTSLLTLFGSHLIENGITNIRPRSVVSSAEKLHGFQRKIISKAFGAPVFDRYGTREVGCIAHECNTGEGLHINAEHVYLEAVHGDDPVAPGESGELLVTSLSNQVFPFIRYRIGDVGALLPDACSCGRGLPLLALTEGRVHDLLTTARGTWLPGEFFPHLFKDFTGVRTFQVHQSRDLTVAIKIVQTPEWTPAQEERYKTEIRKVMGAGLDVRYDYLDQIEPGPSGKLHFTRSDYPVDLASGEEESVVPESDA